MRPAELDWYIFENRIRAIIHQLVEPYALQTMNGTEKAEAVKKEHEKLKRRVDELEFMLHKSHQRASGLDDISKQILFLVRVKSSINLYNYDDVCRTTIAKHRRQSSDRT